MFRFHANTSKSATGKYKFEQRDQMRRSSHTGTAQSRTDQIPSGKILLEGEVLVPVGATGFERNESKGATNAGKGNIRTSSRG